MNVTNIQNTICGEPYYDEEEGWNYKCILGECAPECENCIYNITKAKIKVK